MHVFLKTLFCVPIELHISAIINIYHMLFCIFSCRKIHVYAASDSLRLKVNDIPVTPFSTTIFHLPKGKQQPVKICTLSPKKCPYMSGWQHPTWSTPTLLRLEAGCHAPDHRPFEEKTPAISGPSGPERWPSCSMTLETCWKAGKRSTET